MVADHVIVGGDYISGASKPNVFDGSSWVSVPQMHYVSIGRHCFKSSDELFYCHIFDCR